MKIYFPKQLVKEILIKPKYNNYISNFLSQKVRRMGYKQNKYKKVE